MTYISPEIVELLERDVAETMGERYVSRVRRRAAEMEGLDSEHGGDEKLVDDVQQWFHDVFIDTTWPRCPRHERHPLWYRDKGWWCQQDQVLVCPLGELKSVFRPAV